MKTPPRKILDNVGIVHWGLESLADEERGHYVASHSLAVFTSFDVLPPEHSAKVTCLVCLTNWAP